MSVSTTIPPTWRIKPDEERALGVDMADSLPAGGTVVSVTSVTLVDVETGTSVSLPTPTLTGTVVTVMVTGSALRSTHHYVLTVVVNAGSSAPALVATVEVICTAGY